MNYLIDTNVFSELSKRQPNPGVIRWAEHIDRNSIFISSLSLGEINKGIAKAHPDKQAEVKAWLEVMTKTWFEGRTVVIDDNVALTWGLLLSQHHRTMPVIDSLLAATALTHNLILVTRNTKDFVDIKNLKTINPFL